MIDIIIPAYNCLQTLPRALGSLVAQTKSEKCIVTIIDDCSTEDLSPIIENFKKYLKIRYIKLNKNLHYPGLVRQVGIDNSFSPYLIFLDSDDMLTPQAVEVANIEMRRSNADVILGNFYIQNRNGSYRLGTENDSTWLHGNVYKRSFLEKYNIRFSEGYNEDGAFNTQCFMMSDKIARLEMPMCYWMNNSESLTRSVINFTPRNAADVISTLEFSYLNIKKQIGFSPKILSNIGVHIGLFYKIRCELEGLKEEDFYKDSREKENVAIHHFVCALQLNELSDELLDALKRGFIKGCLTHFLDTPNIPPNDYLTDIGVSLRLEIKDFIPEVK